MTKEVKTKWQTEGDLAVLYQVDNILLFISKKNDPHYSKGQKVTREEVESAGFYKALEYSNDSLPPDAIIDLSFAWSGKS